MTPSTRPSPLAVPSATAASIKPARQPESPASKPGTVSGTSGACSPWRRRSSRLFDKCCRRGEFACVHVGPCPEGERRRKYSQCTGVTRLPDDDGGQLMLNARRPTVRQQRIPGTIAKPNGIQRRAWPSFCSAGLAHELQRGAQRVGTSAPVTADPVRHAAQQKVDRSLQLRYPTDGGRVPRRPHPPSARGSPSRPAYMTAASASRYVSRASVVVEGLQLLCGAEQLDAGLDQYAARLRTASTASGELHLGAQPSRLARWRSDNGRKFGDREKLVRRRRRGRVSFGLVRPRAPWHRVGPGPMSRRWHAPKRLPPQRCRPYSGPGRLTLPAPRPPHRRAPPRRWRRAMPGGRGPTADRSRRPAPDELPCVRSDRPCGRRLSASTDGENACEDRTRSLPRLRQAPSASTGMRSCAAARRNNAASPTGSAAATSSSRRVGSGRDWMRRTKPSSICPAEVRLLVLPKPPTSSAAETFRGTSSRASGMPRVSATMRSRTRSSIRP